MTKKSQETFDNLHKLVMDEIFDQKLALLFLAHLDTLKAEMQLTEERVSDREYDLEDAFVELKIKHNSACNLLRDFAKVVENERGADFHLLYQYKDFLEK